MNKLSTSYSGGKKVLLKGNVVVSDISEEHAVDNFVAFLEQINKASSGSTVVLIAHKGDGFDFPVLVNSSAKYSLLQRVEDLGVLFFDSLKVLTSLNEFKRKGKESRSLSLLTLYKGEVCQVSEVLLAVIPGENFVKYGNLCTVGEVENDISKRSVIRRTVISFQDLPISKGIKEKLTKEGIGLQQPNEVFAKHGTRGL